MITLLTDFGLSDVYVGVMKGVIWGICPQVKIVDITHQIQPQNILEGALALGRAASYFPAETVHVAVVDPGVGTDRRPVAARINAQFFVGPDNGLCTRLVEQARHAKGEIEFFHLNRPEFWLPAVSSVFHGRDIFAPVAAHLALGTALNDLGDAVDAPVLLDIPEPRRTATGWLGQVLQIDHFGNLSTNLEQKHSAAAKQVRLGQAAISGLVHTFAEGKPGQLVALLDSAGMLSINIVNGNAARLLQAQVGDPVEIILE
jgi:S-adenosyl-L-methionine hydrolase (adenosine-forming)